MTLTTHAVVGAAAAELFLGHPVLAFCAGFVSHFAIDALPHWDYKLASMQEDEINPLNADMKIGKAFAFDITHILFDVSLGFTLAAILMTVLQLPLDTAAIGALAGVLPDATQFLYFKTRSKILEPLQRFHIWIQKGKSLEVTPFVGISLQTALVILVYLVLKIFS